MPTRTQDARLGIAQPTRTQDNRLGITQPNPTQGSAQPSGTPIPEWTPDLSRYPTPTNPRGGILYDPSGSTLPYQGEMPDRPDIYQGQMPDRPDIYMGQSPTGPTTVDYNQLGAHTRDVTQEETVQSQLQGLLSSDSPYMDQARLAGERAAASRGALSSSMFAGASQAAAIQASLPIAAQDAQTYSRVLSENAAAINQNTMAKMQSLTQLAAQTIGAAAQIESTRIGASAQIGSAMIGAQSQLEGNRIGASAQIGSAMIGAQSQLESSRINAAGQMESSRIAANTNMEVARMRIVADQDARAFMATHDQVMSAIQHGQTIELANLDYGFRARLAQAGFTHDLNMNELDHAQQQQILFMAHEYGLETIGYQGSIQNYMQDQQLRNSFLQNGMAQVFASINSLNQMGLDGPAFNTAMQNVWKTFGDFMSMFNDMSGGGGFDFDWSGLGSP